MNRARPGPATRPALGPTAVRLHVRRLPALLALAWLSTAGGAGAQERALTLEDVVREAAATHPRALRSDADIRAARGARTTAGRIENPTLDFEVENATLPGESAPPMDREEMLLATVPVHSLIQRWPRVHVANAELAATEADAFARKQEIGLAAARAFNRTAFAQVRLDAASDLVVWLDTIVDYNKVRVSEGVAAEADLIRSQLERDRAWAEQGLAAAELAVARHELGTFLRDPTPARVAVDSLPLPLRASPTETVDDAIARRPDVRAARSQLAAARSNVSLQRLMILPDIGGTLGIKESLGSRSLMFGLSAPIPLFNVNRGEMSRAGAERDAAGFELAAVERDARAQLLATREVAALLAERARGLSGGFLARANEARDIALAAYREGATPLFQVIEASQAWGDARRAFFATLFAQHESVVSLMVAEGLDVTTLSTQPR